jgi:hypothetical protein
LNEAICNFGPSEIMNTPSRDISFGSARRGRCSLVD